MSGEGSAPSRPLVFAPLEFRLQMAEDGAKGRASMYCPNCGAPAFIRDSERVTTTYRWMDYHCTNTACMMAFRAELAVVKVLNPGMAMRDDLHVPVALREEVAHVMPPRGGDADPDQVSMFEGSG